MDGLFSSPEKSPEKLNGFDDDDSAGSGSEMSIEDGKYSLRKVCAKYFTLKIC